MSLAVLGENCRFHKMRWRGAGIKPFRQPAHSKHAATSLRGLSDRFYSFAAGDDRTAVKHLSAQRHVVARTSPRTPTH